MNQWVSGRRIGLVLFGGLAIMFLLAPLLISIPLGLTSDRELSFPPRGYSLQWFQNIFVDARWRDSLILSVQVGLGTAALSLLLGVPMALGLVRGRLPGLKLAYGLVLSPLIVPTVIVAIGMYSVWATGWHIGGIAIGVNMVGSAPGLILADTALALPLVVIIVSASVRSIGTELELAARGLGASPLGAFRFITLPLIRPGLFAAALLGFLASWDESVIALFLSSPIASTVPVRMLTGAREGIDPTVAAVAVVISAVTTILIAMVFVARPPVSSRRDN